MVAAGGGDMITLLDRYIGWRLVLSTLLVLGVLLALFVFIVLVDVLPDYGKGNFGMYELLRYVILSQPRKLYEIFPVAVLVGSLLGLSLLGRSSELIAMRAAGVSKLRIVGASLKTGLLFVLVTIAIGEYVVPTTERLAQTGRAQALSTGFQQLDTGIWLRDGEAFVNLGEVLPDLSLLRVNIYRFSDSQLRTHTAAQRAVYTDDGWRLENVRESAISPEQIAVRTEPSRLWSAGLTPQVVAVFAVRPEALSMQQLTHYIRHLQRNGQETSRYRLVWWQKILLPFATAVMVLLATPFVFRAARGGGLAQRVFVGILFGLAFVVLHRSMGYVGILYGVPAVVSTVLPIAVFLGLALVMLARVR